MDLFKPINSYYDFENIKMVPEGELITRNLSDMDWMYQDQEAVKELLKKDPQIYRYYNVDIPEEEGHLQHCISIINPGKVGNEYNMTKGHFHEIKGTAEIYYTIQGEGMLFMQSVTDGEPEFEALEMKKGSLSYVPPHWAHRTINTGEEPLAFIGIYPGEAGHVYGDIEEKGFMKLLIEKDGEPTIIDNPNYK